MLFYHLINSVGIHVYHFFTSLVALISDQIKRFTNTIAPTLIWKVALDHLKRNGKQIIFLFEETRNQGSENEPLGRRKCIS